MTYNEVSNILECDNVELKAKYEEKNEITYSSDNKSNDNNNEEERLEEENENGYTYSEIPNTTEPTASTELTITTEQTEKMEFVSESVVVPEVKEPETEKQTMEYLEVDEKEEVNEEEKRTIE